MQAMDQIQGRERVDRRSKPSKRVNARLIFALTLDLGAWALIAGAIWVALRIL